MTFSNLGLSTSLLNAIKSTGYIEPTPIQAQAIPAILSGKDVMGAAQTGTGKTAGFVLPLLQLLGGKKQPNAFNIKALVLTPTRELAAQIKASIEEYGKNEKLRHGVVFGGVNINPQKQKIPHIYIYHVISIFLNQRILEDFRRIYLSTPKDQIFRNSHKISCLRTQ